MNIKFKSLKNIFYCFLITFNISFITFGQDNTSGNVSESLDISGLFDAEKPVVRVVYDAELKSDIVTGIDVTIVVSDNIGLSKVVIGIQEYEIASEILFEKVIKFPNNHELHVKAYDLYNNETIYKTQIRLKESVSVVQATTGNKAIERKYYALIIGVNDYEDVNVTSLDEPINDALKLKDILTSQYTFEEENINFLRNPKNADIVVAFDKLSRDISPNDFLLIFYAGHGYYNERTNIGYWLPSDAKKENTALWFRNSALVENLGAINSKHTLLISDACFSGGIFKTRAAFNNADINIADMLKRPSRKAMTSGALTTVPDKSVFMYYFLKILTENQNKYLPSEDLFYDLALRMKNNSNTRPLYGEIQNVGDEGGNFVFIKKD